MIDLTPDLTDLNDPGSQQTASANMITENAPSNARPLCTPSNAA
jgi:hypothetical protein